MNDPIPSSPSSLVATLLGGLALILAIATVVQSWSNRTLQAKVAKDQAQLVKVQALANVNNGLIQLLAKSAVDNNDPALRDLLARNGVTFKASANTNASASPPESSASDEKKKDNRP